MSFVDESKSQFQKVIDHLQQGLATVRTGRATPALVEHLRVEVYGSLQPINTLASISTPDSKTVQIEPWDAGVVKSIETTIQKSDLGINPNVDGKIIRLIMPMMTDEVRQRMVKVVKEKMEEAKIAVRQVREDVKKKIDKQEGVGDDDKRAEQKALDDVVRDMNMKIEAAGGKKTEEVTTI